LLGSGSSGVGFSPPPPVIGTPTQTPPFGLKLTTPRPQEELPHSCLSFFFFVFFFFLRTLPPTSQPKHNLTIYPSLKKPQQKYLCHCFQTQKTARGWVCFCVSQGFQPEWWWPNSIHSFNPYNHRCFGLSPQLHPPPPRHTLPPVCGCFFFFFLFDTCLFQT